MPVLKDVEINLDPRSVALALYRGKKVPEKIVEEIGKAIEQSHDLIHPVALYRWLKVEGVEGERLLLAREDGSGTAELGMGPHAELMAKAELALVSVVTIGGELDRVVVELNKAGKLLEAYLLNCVGVVALAEVDEAVRKYAEKEAKARAWGVSASLAPGSLEGWPIEGQFELCSLLFLDEIGAHLNESGVLVPISSASSLIGIGREYTAERVGSVCGLCMRAETCWRRRD